MRQMAITQRADINAQFSSWILVHAGQSLVEGLCSRTDELPSDPGGLSGLELRAASSHLTILQFAAKNWATYLNYLSTEFRERVSPYCFASGISLGEQTGRADPLRLSILE